MSETDATTSSRHEMPLAPAGAVQGSRRVWIVVAIVLAVAAGAAAWRLLPEDFSVAAIGAALEPHRRAWYAFPAGVLAFFTLSFLMLSVLAMTVVAGWVFGAWLGAACALLGALGSAAAGFWAGRWLGKERLDRLGGLVRRISRKLGENGILAAFLMRKVPAPFTLVNMIAGASRMRFRDFMIGTVLGMGAIVILLAVFGHELRQGLAGERPTALALVFAGVLLVVAFFVNRIAKKHYRPS